MLRWVNLMRSPFVSITRIISIALIAFLLVACGGTPDTQSQETAPEAEPVEEVAPETGEEQEPAPVVEEEESGGDDVPIMDGAYQLQISRTGNNVNYQVDGTIEDVLTFYQEELPKFAWEMAGPPDNAISNIATMLRENADGDRIAVNMQYNELGGFVILTITVSRAD